MQFGVIRAQVKKRVLADHPAKWSNAQQIVIHALFDI
jgi:hypothetical protein